jgi:DNA-binding GntR family transcriptional regulator
VSEVEGAAFRTGEPLCAGLARSARNRFQPPLIRRRRRSADHSPPCWHTGAVTELAVPQSNGELTSHSLVELAVARLRYEILSGATDPGERLVEQHLTQRLGISRAPLREALRLLAEQGLVEHIPRRGSRVATLSDRDVTELYAVRDVLEQYVVTAALPVAGPHRLAGMRAGLDAMTRASRKNDRLVIADAHRAFHVALAALGDNRQLTIMYDQVLTKIQLYMAMNLRREAETTTDQMDGVRRHQRLFEAVRAGDPQTVLAALAGHGARSYLD